MASKELQLSLGILVFMIFSLLLVPHTMHMRNSLLVDDDFSLYLSVLFYVNLGTNLLSSLIGLYSMNSKSLFPARNFVTFLIATELLLLVYLFIEGTLIPTMRRDNLKLMKKSMPKYDWTSQIDESYRRDSGTAVWNAAQGEMCCGITGYQDWDKFRPKNTTASIYPKSCCPNPHAMSGDKGPFCADDSDLYRTSCAQLGENYLSKTLIFFSFYLVYQTVLVVYALKRYSKIYKETTDPSARVIISHVENGQADVTI